MRLTPEQTRIIKTAVARELEPHARIWLFGSKVDDERRGGDIDLYVETRDADLLRELRCKIAIEEAVDLVSAVFLANQPRTAYALSATVR
jgi:predicted nucleotidyltransferase